VATLWTARNTFNTLGHPLGRIMEASLRDFYGTLAQVFPVLMLAVVWESAFLDRLRTQDRSAMRFWTKRRVRNWTIAIVAITVGEIGLITLVLANLVPDWWLPRALVLAGLACVLGTILTRGIVDVLAATTEPPPPDQAGRMT
jgi:hypothetical protein